MPPNRTTAARAAKLPKKPAPPKLPAAPAPAKLPEHDLVDDGLYRELSFGPLDLSGRDAESVEIERCVFNGTLFPATVLERASVSDSTFDRCDLANLRLTSARTFTTVLSGSRMTGGAFTDCTFQDVVFDSCRADLAGFRFSTFRRAVFRDCNLEGVTFQNADVRGVRFEGCRLSGAQFSGATMTGARFSGCDLRGVGGVQSLRGAIVAAEDAAGLLSSLAADLDITIEDAP
ncbi:pentapeptide repeat-containing protein [Actinomadura rubrisoli]|uniref:Pentapeptide repeat-containing protein n=1 Tax=Actinomadura rubrisoli TaxID=2530368 RepID=A0A4R5AUH6_9ACTN|nr:pentapeptide repeat-containing protein [Actinomadura rubrisoli]TDD76691.1 pentapeptide repeat-containing protein [Actinomadura rubrisoli]